MKKIVLIILLGVSVQSQWIQQNSGTNAVLLFVFFVNENTGYAAGRNYKILKTTNGGINWTEQISPISENHNIIFLSSEYGYISVFNGILKTTNGGINWNHFLTPYPNKSIYFTDSLTGYATGRNGNSVVVMKTINGGQAWNTITTGLTSYDLMSIIFPNSQTGYTTGFFQVEPYTFSIVLKTTNAGLSWFTVRNGSRFGNAVFFINPNQGYAVGTEIIKTTNGGITWDSLNFFGLSYFYSIHFPDTLRGYSVGSYEGAGGGGPIYFTTNGGNNWTLSYFHSVRLRSVHFPSALTGYAVGDNGSILKTTNGGITAFTPISAEVPKQFSLSQNYPNPFNPATTIRFAIPSNVKRETSNVRIIIFNILGREITTLVNEQLQPGTYEVEFDGSNYPSGVYYYKLVVHHGGTSTGDYSETRKMVLIK